MNNIFIKSLYIDNLVTILKSLGASIPFAFLALLFKDDSIIVFVICCLPLLILSFMF